MKTRRQQVQGSVAIDYLMLMVAVIVGVAAVGLDNYWTSITTAFAALATELISGPPPL